MPSKAAIEAYHYHVLSGHKQLFFRAENGICEAYRRGYSVVEITRVIGSKKADYVHSVLVKLKVIRQGRRGRPAKGSIPSNFAPYLRKRSLSFSKWCAGWEFEIPEAAEAINAEHDSPIIEAIKRDFPGFYAKIRGLKSWDDYVHPPRCLSDKLEANIVWDQREFCYRASKMNDGSIRGYGLTMELAIKNLKTTHRYLCMLTRLAVGCGVGTEAIPFEQTPTLSG